MRSCAGCMVACIGLQGRLHHAVGWVGGLLPKLLDPPVASAVAQYLEYCASPADGCEGAQAASSFQRGSWRGSRWGCQRGRGSSHTATTAAGACPCSGAAAAAAAHGAAAGRPQAGQAAAPAAQDTWRRPGRRQERQQAGGRGGWAGEGAHRPPRRQLRRSCTCNAGLRVILNESCA